MSDRQHPGTVPETVPKIVLADDDHTIKLIRYALEGEGEVSAEWVRAYFSPEPADLAAVREPARLAGLADRCRVAAGHTGSAEELLARVAGAAVIIYRRGTLSRAVIAKAKGLRLIQRLGARPEGIDMEAARAAGVAVSCIPRRTLAYTAEHALLLMLAVAKRLVEGDAAVRAGTYDRALVQPINNVAYNWPGFSALGGLSGETLGIVGLGEVGVLVAQRAASFGMRVLYTKRTRLPAEQEAALNVSYRSLPELLAESDYVSLHATATAETESLFNRKTFAMMKPGSVFVNTSRGRLVDEAALLEALSSGRLRGAGLDNHRIEPRAAEDPLNRLSNVVLTPHNAGGSRLGLLREITVLLANCSAALRGGEIQHAFLPLSQRR